MPWIAGIAMCPLALAACGSLGDQTAAPQMTEIMTGRWMLSAPNAPPCGMNFGGALGLQEGTLVPEGGCPEKFFLSRSWTLDQNTQVIKDDSGRFDGQSTAGTPVTLNR